jgi:hypothetical protein
MALVAGYLFVETRKRILRLVVIKAAGGFPTVERVTAPAIRSQLAAMHILVAGGALCAGQA